MPACEVLNLVICFLAVGLGFYSLRALMETSFLFSYFLLFSRGVTRLALGDSSKKSLLAFLEMNILTDV